MTTALGERLVPHYADGSLATWATLLSRLRASGLGNSLGLTYVFHCVPLCSHVSLLCFHTFYGIEDWSIIPALYSLRHTGITFDMCFSSPSWALWAHNKVITDRKDGKIRLTMMAPVTFVLILVMCLCLGGTGGDETGNGLHTFFCHIICISSSAVYNVDIVRENPEGFQGKRSANGDFPYVAKPPAGMLTSFYHT